MSDLKTMPNAPWIVYDGSPETLPKPSIGGYKNRCLILVRPHDEPDGTIRCDDDSKVKVFSGIYCPNHKSKKLGLTPLYWGYDSYQYHTEFEVGDVWCYAIDPFNPNEILGC